MTINAGSSGIKFGLFETGGTHQIKLMSRGQIEGIGAAPHFLAKDAVDFVLT